MRGSIIKKYRLPLVLVIILAGLFPIMGSCGGGGGGGSSPGSAPVISSLSWWPQSATYMEGGGAVDVKCDLLYRDSDGDIRTLRVTDSDGGSITHDISATMGSSTSGLLTFYLPADTSIIGTFTFQIWLIDSRENASNQLSGSFTVNQQPVDSRMYGYKLYANNLTTQQTASGRYSGGWNGQVKEFFLQDNWVFVGEVGQVLSSQTYTVPGACKDFIIYWERSGINFDSFDDPTSGVAIGRDHLGDGAFVDLTYSNCNFTYYLVGLPDGNYATTVDGNTAGGYLLFKFYDGGNVFNPAKIRITLIN